MSLLRRSVIILLWLAVAVAYVAAILPQTDAPSLGASDKIDHMTAFFTVAVLARLAYPGRRVATLYLWVVNFGGLIELSQALPFIGRDAEWADWVADAIAALGGMIVAWPLAVFAERRRGQRRSAAAQAIEQEAQPQP